MRQEIHSIFLGEGDTQDTQEIHSMFLGEGILRHFKAGDSEPLSWFRLQLLQKRCCWSLLICARKSKNTS